MSRSRLVEAEYPLRHEGDERARERSGLQEDHSQEEAGRQPAGRQLDPRFPIPQHAEYPDEDHPEQHQLDNGFGPWLHRPVGERRADEQNECPGFDHAVGPANRVGRLHRGGDPAKVTG